ncbi:hypothetical protein [Mucilaginibacter segetis]|uniref:Uncharacterized protein n=1 Tax=Mucilaginibacter segetis TaxID=2793071 RepID=A0A934UNT6_9SPHI|nr:hypothetical protein [Mucilaginibacter segetis]MBK0381128.1 hypothetical protein [Mucilaginibacter segetis]
MKFNKYLSFSKFKSEKIISVFAVLISLMSVFFSWLSLTISSKQFEIVNQSYLSLNMSNIGITLPDNDNIVTNIIANDELLVQGFNSISEISNVGNIPLKYEVVIFNIYNNGQIWNRIDNSNKQIIEGVLYPKQTTNFQLSTTLFRKNKKLIPFGEVKKMKLEAEVLINYSDVNKSHIKSVHRVVKFIFHNNIVEVLNTRIDDKI